MLDLAVDELRIEPQGPFDARQPRSIQPNRTDLPSAAGTRKLIPVGCGVLMAKIQRPFHVCLQNWGSDITLFVNMPAIHL